MVFGDEDLDTRQYDDEIKMMMRLCLQAAVIGGFCKLAIRCSSPYRASAYWWTHTNMQAWLHHHCHH